MENKTLKIIMSFIYLFFILASFGLGLYRLVKQQGDWVINLFFMLISVLLIVDWHRLEGEEVSISAKIILGSLGIIGIVLGLVGISLLLYKLISGM